METTKSPKHISVAVERLIPAQPDQLFDAWFDPKIPGNPWNIADKFILDRKIDGLFYWAMKDNAHYGRFILLERPVIIQKTWVSKTTHGEETIVTINFAKQGEKTLMSLVHSNLPDSESGREHEQGWNFFLSKFLETFDKKR